MSGKVQARATSTKTPAAQRSARQLGVVTRVGRRPVYLGRVLSADDEAEGEGASLPSGPRAEGRFIARFQVTAEVLHGPEHEVPNSGKAPEGARLGPRRVNQFGADPRHELDASRQGPWLLEQEIDRGFRCAVRANGRDPALEL